ncbi:MAG: glycosyltransferase [Anaerolineae bacterium]|nr:glycosyltransferase [Anaerolineae bacterium]NUQ03259.1 glycosyltransferase [Anaerolineae bacterium]
MRILFVASLHHPEALRAAVDAAPPGEAQPLFPPTTAQHFYERALRRRGHEMAVFYRNTPGTQTARFSERLSPGKLLTAALNRVPPQVNPLMLARNHALLECARGFRPHILWMVGDNTNILPETLASIRSETGCKLLYACGTSPIVFTHAIDRAAARLYDLVIANDYYHGVQWLEMGAARMECLPISACDPTFHKPYMLDPEDRRRFACDIAFVGTLTPSHLYSRRVRALEALRDFDLGIWSVHDVPASLRQHVRGRALGEDMERILSAAKICVNTHGDFVFYGGNMRLFEVAGAEVFQLTDDLPGVRAWFPEQDGAPMVLTYHDSDDLREKVRYYLAHDDERKAAAARAQAHVYAHHTYDQRVERLEALFAELLA